jgi:starch phosphorylase
MAGGAKATTANNGWAIGAEIKGGTVDFQSEVDSDSLYQLLENQIIPLYYAKPDGKLPLAWLQLMRGSIRSITPVFNTHRMVKEYTERLYIPAARAHKEFAENGCAAATELSKWKARMRKDWPQVSILDVQVGNPIAKTFRLAKRCRYREDSPWRRCSGSCSGRGVPREAENGGIKNPSVTVLDGSLPAEGEGNYTYQGLVPASDSGTYGFSVRVVQFIRIFCKPTNCV